jgi:hypothetical protein
MDLSSSLYVGGLLGCSGNTVNCRVRVAKVPGCRLPIGQSDLARLVFEMLELVHHLAIVILASAGSQDNGVGRRTDPNQRHCGRVREVDPAGIAHGDEDCRSEHEEE